MILTTFEVEGIVKGLQPIPMVEIGSAQWKAQRDYIEQLNITAHANASRRHDDFVAQSFVTHEKMSILLHELLIVDTFRRNVLQNIRSEVLATPTGHYMYVHYEGVLLNLIECILYQEENVKALDEDCSELLEYCWRNVAEVLAKKGTMHDWFKRSLVKRSAQEALAASEEASKSDDALRFKLAMSSLSCIWFVVERITQLPMGVLNCALTKMDLILSMAEVIDVQPWLLRDPKLGTYKFVQGEFKSTSHEDSLILCTPEAHCWFTLHLLMCDPTSRRKYPYTSHRKDNLARIRKFLHEVLIDQVPMLTDVQRALDEMSFIQQPTNTQETFKTSLVIEAVPRVISAVEAEVKRAGGYRKIGDTIKARVTHPDAIREDAMKLAKLFESMFPEQSTE
eukprot:PhF_6_TR3433/c0_g1_i1/m.4999